MNHFIIKQKLPGLNEYINANRTNAYMGARFKAEVEETIIWAINQARAAETLHRPEGRIIVNFEWHERTKRRDADNIASAKKFILDALVKSGVLIDDSRKYVVGFHDTIIDDKADFVIVDLIDLKERGA